MHTMAGLYERRAEAHKLDVSGDCTVKVRGGQESTKRTARMPGKEEAMRRRFWVPALLAMLVGVVSSVPVAAGTGTGEHEGTVTLTNTVLHQPPPPPPCIMSTLSYSSQTGKAAIATANPNVAYVGPVSISYTVDGTATSTDGHTVSGVIQNNTATYSDTRCTQNPGYPWPTVTNGTLDGTNSAGDEVHCIWSSGTFSRVSAEHTVTLTNGSCTVSMANGASETQSDTLVSTGTSDTPDCTVATQPPTSCHYIDTFTLTSG